MKDFVGITLNVGDFVAAARPGYRDLILGRVIKLTPQKVRVEYRAYSGSLSEHLYDPNTLVRLEGPHLTAMLIKGS